MKIPVPFYVLRAVIDYVEEEQENIRLDIENKGLLRPVLSWFIKEELI